MSRRLSYLAVVSGPALQLLCCYPGKEAVVCNQTRVVSAIRLFLRDTLFVSSDGGRCSCSPGGSRGREES